MKKIYPLNILAKIVSKQKAKGKKIALCHGVFDLLHIGHIKHFKEAKSLTDTLIVTITSDKSDLLIKKLLSPFVVSTLKSSCNLGFLKSPPISMVL